ncbi:hypothetical protein C8E89_14212 [Mycolicibacterium moriokaense]|uniref:Cytochrome P450 n=2 Tax=Mycolicibacterium moriokaense TaxID=39691 RepID=A0A318H584_9MYCO|nr:hypothetical protein C8E89_14212 [Mycolicibacterium moriokaense]
MQTLFEKFGSSFTMRLPFFGPTVVISDPSLIKEFFALPADAVQGVEPNLSSILGSGSTFGLHGDDHRARRKLILPHFNGPRLAAYNGLIERETRHEVSEWPEGIEFPVLPSMLRITLNTILRSVMGADGQELEALRTILPRFMAAGSKLAFVPFLQRDLGPGTPWRQFAARRAEFDNILESLIARAGADPEADHRVDVLSLMLRARYEDGSAMSHDDIKDELLTLVVAGHETTATSLAWAIERLRRHPKWLAQLVEALDVGDTALLQATVYETQRVRPVIDAAARQVVAPSIRLGDWVIPEGYTVTVNIGLTHQNASAFPDADRYMPERFIDERPGSNTWVPFGGGNRRCPGASLANLEMVTVLQTLLEEFTIEPTNAKGERWKSRGVAFAPGLGGRAVIQRRKPLVGRGEADSP